MAGAFFAAAFLAGAFSSSVFLAAPAPFEAVAFVDGVGVAAGGLAAAAAEPAAAVGAAEADFGDELGVPPDASAPTGVMGGAGDGAFRSPSKAANARLMARSGSSAMRRIMGPSVSFFYLDRANSAAL